MSYSRKKSREIAFRMLFAQNDCMQLACEDEPLPTGRELDYINNLYKAAIDNLATIDEIISGLSKDFSLDRIYKTDITALRMAIAEMKYTDTPKHVAVNEAIDIAKKYGTQNNAPFVNGILSKVEV